MQQRRRTPALGSFLPRVGALLLFALLLVNLHSCLWIDVQDRVFVYSDPAGAEVWVNGEDSGKTTPAELELGGLMGSDHLIEIRKTGFETERRIVKHYDDFKTSQWDEAHGDLITPAWIWWWTTEDLLFPFEVEAVYRPQDVYVRLFPEGTFKKLPEDPQLETTR